MRYIYIYGDIHHPVDFSFSRGCVAPSPFGGRLPLPFFFPSLFFPLPRPTRETTFFPLKPHLTTIASIYLSIRSLSSFFEIYNLLSFWQDPFPSIQPGMPFGENVDLIDVATRPTRPCYLYAGLSEGAKPTQNKQYHHGT